MRLLFGFPGSTHLPVICPMNLAVVSAFCETTGSICLRILAVVWRPFEVDALTASDPAVFSLCDAEVSGLADERDAVSRLSNCHITLLFFVNKLWKANLCLPRCCCIRGAFSQSECWAIGCSTRHNYWITGLIREMYMGSRDTQLNFGTLNDILCRRSYEYFYTNFSSIALEEVSLKCGWDFQNNVQTTADYPFAFRCFRNVIGWGTLPHPSSFLKSSSLQRDHCSCWSLRKKVRHSKDGRMGSCTKS